MSMQGAAVPVQPAIAPKCQIDLTHEAYFAIPRKYSPENDRLGYRVVVDLDVAPDLSNVHSKLQWK